MFTKIAQSNWLKIVLFITTFAFVGTGFVALVVYKLSGNISGVAQVNGEDITQQEFIYEVNQIEAKYQNQGIDISPMRKIIYAQVLDNLINRQLLYQFAKEEGIEATEEEVKKLILDIPAFQKNGKFDKQSFLSFLQSMNISPQLFEKILRKQLSAQHVLDILKAGFYITEDEIDTFLKKRLSSINAKLITIQPEVNITEKELKDYYEKNKEKFSQKKGKKIKIFKIATDKKDSKLKAQKLFSDLKSGNIPSNVKPIFDDVFLKGKKYNLPEKVLEKIKNLFNNTKIEFIKTKNAYYLIYYEGEKAIPMPYKKAKTQVKNSVLEEKRGKILKKIKESISREKSLNLKLLKEKYNAKIEEIKNEKYMQLQFKYGLSPTELDELVKIKNGFSKPYILKDKVVIFYITKVIPPSSEEYEKSKKQLKPLLEDQKFNDIISMLINKLKDEADIKINNRVLQ